MAIQNLYGQPIVSSGLFPTSANYTTQALSATNNAVASFFIFEGGHGGIIGIRYNVTARTTPSTYRFSIQGITSRATPDGTIKSSGNAFVDVSPGATGVATATLGTSYSGTIGDALSCVCIYQSGTTPDASHTMTLAAATNVTAAPNGPYAGLETTGTWAVSVGLPALAPVYSDGYVGRFFNVRSSATNNQPTSASSPLYFGSAWTPSIQGVISGAYVGIRPAAGSGILLSLFEAGTNAAVASTTVNTDLNAEATNPVQPFFIPLTPYTAIAGTEYRLVVSPTNATAWTTFVSQTFANAVDLQAVNGPLTGTTGTNATPPVWTDNAPVAYPVVPCLDSFTEKSFAAGVRRRGGM